jgi:hypothetical protein
MSPAEEDEEFWGSLKRIASENEKSEDKTAALEETAPLQTPQVIETTLGETETHKKSVLEELDSTDGTKTGEASTSSHMSETDDLEGGRQVPVPCEKILQRINSKKDMKSYHLGKQLSSSGQSGRFFYVFCSG